MADEGVYYGDYLQLDKVLGAQAPESDKKGIDAHDEMLFIIIHQTYELWFKQILHEVGSVIDIFTQERIDDNSPGLPISVHRLNRVGEILEVAVKQIDILETMTPLDFLDYRDLLRPASGFQSWQFKVLEARLGLKMENRHAKHYYLSQLRKEHVDLLQHQESLPTLLGEVNDWLERMPYFNQEYWPGTGADRRPFWSDLRDIYEASLVQGEEGNLDLWDNMFFAEEKGERKFSSAACRSALFIMLYRDQPLLHLPFRLLGSLLDIDEGMATWRYRHINMVGRMIGMRVGTGGSTGKAYLKGALERHYVFQEIADLSSFLIDRRHLPTLPEELKKVLGFRAGGAVQNG